MIFTIFHNSEMSNRGNFALQTIFLQTIYKKHKIDHKNNKAKKIF